MGIQELTDTDGYYASLGAPEREAKKAAATVAQAENERDARIRAAQAELEAKQAEEDAQREILGQQEERKLREVELRRRTDLANAQTDREIQEERAAAEEKRYYAEKIVPAQALAKEQEIQAHAAKVVSLTEAEAAADKLRIETEIANSTRVSIAQAERRSREETAEAALLEAMRAADAKLADEEAVAKGIRAKHGAEADGIRLVREAEAAGEEALAKALMEKAEALAAQGNIAVLQEVAIALVNAIKEAEVARAGAIGQLGQKMEFTYLGGGNGNGASSANPILSMIEQLPLVLRSNELSSQALGQMTVSEIITRASDMLGEARQIATPTVDSDDASE